MSMRREEGMRENEIQEEEEEVVVVVMGEGSDVAVNGPGRKVDSGEKVEGMLLEWR